MRRWRHPTSRDLWVSAHPAPSEPRGCCPRSHRSWAFFKTPARCKTSQATSQKYFLLGFRATPSIPTFLLLISSQVNIRGSMAFRPPQMPYTFSADFWLLFKGYVLGRKAPIPGMCCSQGPGPPQGTPWREDENVERPKIVALESQSSYQGENQTL